MEEEGRRVKSTWPLASTADEVGVEELGEEEEGVRVVRVMEVNGKVDEFGFPARREIIPGVFSRGNRPRMAVGFLCLAAIERKES